MSFQFLTDGDIRRYKAYEWIGFAIHAFVFLVVNIVLFNLNDWVGPYNFYINNVHITMLQWRLYPLIGWGAGLALHLLIILTLSSAFLHWRDAQIARLVAVHHSGPTAPSKRLLKWALQKSDERLGFYIHLFFYVAINIILVVLNLSGIGWEHETGTQVPIFPWFWFPLLGWGFGFAIHSIVYLFATVLAGYREKPGAPTGVQEAGDGDESAATEIPGGEYAEYKRCERIAEARVRFFRHAIIFMFVNAAVYGADLFLHGELSFAPWVTFIWAFFLFFHFMKAFLIHKDHLQRMKMNQIDKLMGNK